MKTVSVSVLIVERQPMMLVALSSALSAGGINVIAEVKNIGKLMQTAKRLNPNLILYSVSEPTQKDFQAISALRRELPLVSILALVDDEFQEKKDAAMKHGSHMVLTKATPRLELLDAIKRLYKMQNGSE